MILSVRMKNFRRHADETLRFEAGTNFVEGENNAGKTSILYAIEYALFGRVDGFKSPLALLRPGARGLGVELCFTGNDGQTYRLQRVHQLAPRSRSKLSGRPLVMRLVYNSSPAALSMRRSRSSRSNGSPPVRLS